MTANAEKPSTREAIVSAATELFHRKGYFAASMSDIAGGCGIQKAGIYYYFQGKETLLFDIMKRIMDDLLAHLQKSLEGAEGVEDAMRAAVRGHVEFHLNRQKETFIASSELRGLTPEHYRAVVMQRDAYERIFQSLIQRGMDQNVFADGDVKILSYAILTLCTAGAFWFKPSGRLSVDDIAAIYVDFVLNGLKDGAGLPFPAGENGAPGADRFS
jgi:AcrR family transcriptional regulator